MSTRPIIFMIHSYGDKPFARRLASDLSARGAGIWLDEAELKMEDAQFEKIDSVLEQIDHLAVIMTPESMDSIGVRKAIRQALKKLLSSREIVILPILLKDCTIPRFLRGNHYEDFREEAFYEITLKRLAQSLGLSEEQASPAEVPDPFAARFGRVESYYARPRVWHCIYCGWRCDLSYDNYFCHQCESIRPFFAPGATMVECKSCKQWSLGIALYCEWCGERFASGRTTD